jgi:hypothetical protein
MKFKIPLIAVSGTILLFMIWQIINTSLESSLFDELPKLVQIPWMEATLYDFYANVFFIYLWIFYKEKNWVKKISWLFFLILMGSVATCVYILKELFSLKENEEITLLLTRQNP